MTIDAPGPRAPTHHAWWAAGVLLLLVVVGVIVTLVAWPRSPLQGETSHDFGTVSFERGPHWSDHTFQLTNVSSQPLRVKRAISSCGCTQALPPDSLVAQGDVLEVPVTLRLLDSGLKESKVTLILEDGRRVALHVRGIGVARESLQATPERLLLRPPRGIGVITLTAQGPTMPSETIITPPEGLSVESQAWSSKAPAKPALSRPATWEATLICTAEGDGPVAGTVIVVEVPDHGSIDIPVGMPFIDQQRDRQDAAPAPESPPASPPGDH